MIRFLSFFIFCFPLTLAFAEKNDHPLLLIAQQLQTGRNLNPPYDSSPIEASVVELPNENLLVGGLDLQLYLLQNQDKNWSMVKLFKSKGPFTSQAVISKKSARVFITSAEGSIHGLDFNGQIQKSVSLAKTVNWKTMIVAPVLELDNSDLIVGNQSGELFCLRADLEIRWKLSLEGKIWRQVVQVSESIIMLVTFEETQNTSIGHHYFIEIPNAKNHLTAPKILKDYTSLDSIYSTPVLWKNIKGQIHVLVEDAQKKQLVVYDERARKIQSLSLPGNLFNSPLVLPSQGLVLGLYKGSIQFYDPQLNLINTVVLPEGSSILASPISLGENKVLVVTLNGEMYIFDTKGNLVQREETRISSRATPTFLASKRQIIWSNEKGGINIFNLSSSEKLFGPLLKELKQINYPTQFIDKTYGQVDRIRFSMSEEENARALFMLYPIGTDEYTDMILYPSYMKNNLGQFKDLAYLSEGDLDNFYHEMWHAYFFHEFEYKNSDEFRYLQKRAKEIYPNLNSTDALAVLNEAMAVFIGQMMSHFHFIQRHLEDVRKLGDKFENIHDHAFKYAYSGYYYDSKGRPIFVPTPLPEIEKIWILENIFEGKLGH